MYMYMYIDSSVAVIVVTVANSVVTLASQPAQPGETLVLMVVNNTELSTYPQDTDLAHSSHNKNSFLLFPSTNRKTRSTLSPPPPPNSKSSTDILMHAQCESQREGEGVREREELKEERRKEVSCMYM